MGALIDILKFRTMIAPVLLQIMFWAGIAGSLYGTYVLIKLGNWAWPFSLIFGILATRVIFEGAILAFRMYDRLADIQRAIEETRRSPANV